MKVETFPFWVAVGVPMQELTPADPEIDQIRLPEGATAPDGPATVAVNTMFPLSVPSLTPIKETTGGNWATLTERGVVGGSDV